MKSLFEKIIDPESDFRKEMNEWWKEIIESGETVQIKFFG